MNILTLSIKQKYFDEILAGTKTHENREIRPTNAKKNETGTDVSRMGTDISLMIVLMFCCVASACNADDVPFDLDIDKFADGLDMDALNGFAEAMNAGSSKKKTEETPPPTSTN